MIEIDGSHGEAGGQILRTALAFSTFTGKPFKITNIRKNRPKPGLKAQHLNCLKLLSEITDCKYSDVKIGSEELEFVPGKFTSRKAEVDIGTAGSITLLLQSVMAPIIFLKKKIRVTLIGGTDVSWSPSIDYFKHVFLPAISELCDVEIKVLKRGYYPKGQGKVELMFRPKEEFGIIDMVSKGKLMHVKGVSHASSDLEGVADRQAKIAKMICKDKGVPVNIQTQYCVTDSKGSGVTLWAVYRNTQGEMNYYKPIICGADVLGEKGIKSEIVGRKCAEKLFKEDEFIVDQILPFLVFNKENKISCKKLSDHAKSNMYVVEQFIDGEFVNKDGVLRFNKNK